MTCDYPAPQCCVCPTCSNVPPNMLVTASRVGVGNDCPDCLGLNTVHILHQIPEDPCSWYAEIDNGCDNDDLDPCATYALMEVAVGYYNGANRATLVVQIQSGEFQWEKVLPPVINCYGPITFDSGDLIRSLGTPNCDFSGGTFVAVGSDSAECP